MRIAVDFIASIQKEEFVKGVEYGQSKGATKEKTTTIERMLRSGEFSESQIAYVSNSSLEKVREIETKLGLQIKKKSHANLGLHGFCAVS